MEQLFLPPIIAAAIMGLQWLLWGRTSHQTIMAVYEPPKDLSILECGILIDDAVNSKDIALELYNLYLKNILVLKEKDSFVLNPELDEKRLSTLTSSEKLVLQNIIGPEKGIYTSKQTFESVIKNVAQNNPLTISELGVDFIHKAYLSRLAKKVTDLKFQLYDIMTAEGYFPVSPFNQRKPFLAIGAVIFAGPLSWNIYNVSEKNRGEFVLPWQLVIGLSLAGLIIAFASLLLVRKTEKGIKAKTAILGLKEYILTAESDRIKFVIQNDINAYKALLPYAALFDSLDRWIEPLDALNKTLKMSESANISSTISAMDVDLSITEKSRFLRAILDLFTYGFKILVSYSGPKRHYSDYE